MLLRKLQMKFFRDSFNDSVLNACDSIVLALLEDENSERRDVAQKHSEFKYFDVIRKKGEKEINDFKKMIMQEVKEIVQNENPINDMRKKLIQIIHGCTLNNLFMDEKFFERRQEIYEVLNKYIDDKEFCNADETTAIMITWYNAESTILRLLQNCYFERISNNDWYVRYSKFCYETMSYHFELMLDRIDNNEYDVVTKTLWPHMIQQLHTLQKEITGEVVCPVFSNIK